MPYQKLFDYLSKELGVTPLVSQMQEIVAIAVEAHEEVQQIAFQEQTLAAVDAAEYEESADDEWGEQNHNPVEWVAILGEEFGEVSKEAVDYHFRNMPKGMDEKEIGKCGEAFHAIQLGRLEDYRKELIQLAAVAVSMIQSLERNELYSFEVEDLIY